MFRTTLSQLSYSRLILEEKFVTILLSCKSLCGARGLPSNAAGFFSQVFEAQDVRSTPTMYPPIFLRLRKSTTPSASMGRRVKLQPSGFLGSSHYYAIRCSDKSRKHGVCWKVRKVLMLERE